MEAHWNIHQSDPNLVSYLQNRLSCHPATAKVLVNRKITDPDQARRFIYDGLGQLPAPFELQDLEIAAERILQAVRNQERILIFGDYDVDGITATSLLVKFLVYLGARVDYYIPHRTREGYGLKPIHIESVAAPGKVDLIITVDCGISAHDAIESAAALGVDVIVTDHHRVGDRLPPALAVINPQRPDCPSGFDHLSGAGVAFYLLIYLRKYLREHEFWSQGSEPSLKGMCDFAALGTVADMMPLTGANRLLVKAGLDILNHQPSVGLEALMGVSRLTKGTLDAEDLAFRLVPRLNAAGRMGHANMAVRLLLTPQTEQAEHLAQNLDALNRKRQQIEGQMVEDITSHLEARPQLLHSSALVLANETWHEGVLGIAASRIARRFHRPVVLIAMKDGRGRGSARSIEGFDLYRGLSGCSDDLRAFGGHAMAAGLEIEAENLDSFREGFQRRVAGDLDIENCRPTLKIDSELRFDQIDPRLLDELELLQPYGNRNPQPLFMARDVRVSAHRKLGNSHRRLTLEQNGSPMEAIHFNIDPQKPPPVNYQRIAFRLKWNRWKGAIRPQIILESV